MPGEHSADTRHRAKGGDKKSKKAKSAIANSGPPIPESTRKKAGNVNAQTKSRSIWDAIGETLATLALIFVTILGALLMVAVPVVLVSFFIGDELELLGIPYAAVPGNILAAAGVFAFLGYTLIGSIVVLAALGFLARYATRIAGQLNIAENGLLWRVMLLLAYVGLWLATSLVFALSLSVVTLAFDPPLYEQFNPSIVLWQTSKVVPERVACALTEISIAAEVACTYLSQDASKYWKWYTSLMAWVFFGGLTALAVFVVDPLRTRLIQSFGGKR